MQVTVWFVLQARSGGASLRAGEIEVAAEPGSSSRSEQSTGADTGRPNTSSGV